MYEGNWFIIILLHIAMFPATNSNNKLANYHKSVNYKDPYDFKGWGWMIFHKTISIELAL